MTEEEIENKKIHLGIYYNKEKNIFYYPTPPSDEEIPSNEENIQEEEVNQ